MTAGEGAAWADAWREAMRREAALGAALEAARPEAARLQAEHPGWRVSPVRRSSGIGLEAVRDGGRILALIGEAGEVRAALEQLDRQASSASL